MENYPPTHNMCQDGEPLLKLQEGGKAPILNYSLQQDTSFTAYSSLSMNLPDAYFTPLAKQIPEGLPTRTEPLSVPYLASSFAITYDDGVVEPMAWGNIEVLSAGELMALRRQAQGLNMDSAVRTKRLNDLIISNITVEEASATLEGGDNQLVGFPTIARTWKEILEDYLEGYNPTYIAAQRNLGYPIIITERNGGGKRITYGTRPSEGGIITATPQLYFVEEYQTISFARDYGAGKTLQIHSLFPGEKTTVTIKTFKELKTVKSNAENIIDSFSQESAKEFEDILERESSKNTTKTRGGGANANANVSLSPPKGGSGSVGGGAHFSASNTRISNTRNLSKAVSKSVDKSNSSRQININTSTQETQTESEEVATVRQFENINKSRVLNLAFRELLQQYITIVYLRDVKIMFSNGHAEYDLIYSIEDLNELLATHIIDDAKREEVKDLILFEYGKLKKEGNNDKITTTLSNEQEGLIEAFSQTNFSGESIRYLRKNTNLQNIYRHTPEDIKGYAVDGVILDVQQYTLRTPAVVVDAFLGQGEALDCFAVKLLEADITKANIANDKTRLENERIQRENEKIALDNTLRDNNKDLERQKIEREAQRLEQETIAIDALVRAFSNGQVTPSQFADAIGNIFHPNPPKARWSYTSQNG